MTKRELKNSLYVEISRISKAMSNSNRMEIIDYISNGEKCVEEIALQTGISIANTSQHLQNLKKERLVSSRKKGVQVYYTLASEEVYKAWIGLRNLTLQISPYINETISEIRRAFDYEEPFSLQDIKERDDICFLDVRPKDEFNKGHLPNALSIPIGELKDRIKDVPKEKLIIAYCRGMFCMIADEAVKILQEKGYNAKKIEESVLDYKMLL